MPQINDHVHTVQYYETDKMGVTHHSNYIRWMEEARVSFLEQTGWDYSRLEDMGLVSPVVSLNCEYKHPTRFADKVSVHVEIEELRSVTIRFSYTMKDQDGNTVFTGTSLHAFFDAEGKPLKVKKEHPDLYGTLSSLVRNGSE